MTSRNPAWASAPPPLPPPSDQAFAEQLAALRQTAQTVWLSARARAENSHRLGDRPLPAGTPSPAGTASARHERDLRIRAYLATVFDQVTRAIGELERPIQPPARHPAPAGRPPAGDSEQPRA